MILFEPESMCPSDSASLKYDLIYFPLIFDYFDLLIFVSLDNPAYDLMSFELTFADLADFIISISTLPFESNSAKECFEFLGEDFIDPNDPNECS